MPSTKEAAERRVKLPRRSDCTNTFRKTWERLNKAGKLDMSRLKEVMGLLIADDEPLGSEWSDHALHGREWKGCRECHVGGDFLLVYKITADGAVIFVDAGSHAELFG